MSGSSFDRAGSPPVSPAPCRAACPVGTDAAAYVALIEEGRFAEAYDVARNPNPFPSICGRICAAPCERACRRGIIDRPIAIRALKRVLSEAHGVEAGAADRWRRPIGEVPPADRDPVAIVGGGPAGLSAAHDLRLSGHPVTVFESAEVPGGMLVQGVPSFRLPRSLVEREIEAIGELGVAIRTRCEVGRDVTVEGLLDDYAAVLVAVGCRQGRLLDLEGSDLSGVMRAIDFLRRIHTSGPDGASAIEWPVVVVGGGSVAFDTARSAWRLQRAEGWDGQTVVDAVRTAVRSGAPTRGGGVLLVAPESREQLSVPREELAEAEREGVVFRGHVGVRRIVGDDRVEGVEVSPVLSLYDDQGEFAPRLDDERSETLPARSVVLAIGQQADTSFLAGFDHLERTSWGGVAADRWGRTSDERLFVAGDVATGPRDLIDAIAAGQRAASAIAHRLAGRGPVEVLPDRAIVPPRVPPAPPLRDLRRFETSYDRVPRVSLPMRPRSQRDAGTEVEATLELRAAAGEAFRCLRCDEHLHLFPHRCVACGLCADVCPETSLSLVPAGSSVALVLNEDTCIRCGLCVARCPGDALGFVSAPPTGGASSETEPRSWEETRA